jgi:hypothetical protein
VAAMFLKWVLALCGNHKNEMGLKDGPAVFDFAAPSHATNRERKQTK